MSKPAGKTTTVNLMTGSSLVVGSSPDPTTLCSSVTRDPQVPGTRHYKAPGPLLDGQPGLARPQPLGQSHLQEHPHRFERKLSVNKLFFHLFRKSGYTG